MDQTMREARALPSKMALTDKLRLLGLLLDDLQQSEEVVEHYLARVELSRIEQTEGVCGGDACIAGTRIPVWLIEEFRRAGASDAEILQAYPSLSAEDVVAAKAYVGLNPEDIDRQIRANELR
ncbi:MAG: DUF433 domain-containing protein [Trueperaceae bacterium]|nr:DUF433 domain-containing protein [Trueperaceae bacterium]